VPACKAALATDPENARLLFQMGRALQASYDYGQARIYFEKSAAKGHAGARQNLAVFYMEGSGGLPKSDEDAVRLLRLAADQRLALAQFSLGGLYETGRGGLPKSDTEAVRLYRLAADQGEPHALARLALYYAAGRGGLQKDASEASRLCNLAADKDPTLADRLPQCWASPRWMTAYAARIAQILDQHKRFPAAAYLQRAHGTVVLDFVLERNGRLAYSHVKQSSGWAILDNEALSILQRSQPFPPLPDNYSEQRLSLSVPLNFAIQLCTLNLLQLGASKTGLPACQ
jgi:TonB family protein